MSRFWAMSITSTTGAKAPAITPRAVSGGGVFHQKNQGFEVEGAYAPPAYLQKYYWWTYVHPAAVRLFERQWLIDLILWGNYESLREAALDEFGEELPGATLQIACVYGDLSARIAERAKAGGGTLDVVDALPVQLKNLRAKLPEDAPVSLTASSSADLPFTDASFERVLLFFLLHEMPRDVREATLAHALRVLKPGGKLVIVDYAKPRLWHPARWIWYPIIGRLEPFAKELWSNDLRVFMPEAWRNAKMQRSSYFGGLYQKVVLEKDAASALASPATRDAVATAE